MDDQKEQPQKSLCCPTTGQIVAALKRVDVWVGFEPVTWWHCPACLGWHLQSVIKTDSEKNDE